MNVTAALRSLWGNVLRSRQHRLVILTDPPAPSSHPPIFIVGCPRSGTSLLRRIVDSHSRIACPPESHFLRPLLDTLADRRSMVGLEAMGFDHEVVASRTRAFAEQFFVEYAAAKGKPRWADKTPLYVDCLEQVEELFGGTPRYLMLYRHGLDVAFSMTKVFGEQLFTIAPEIRKGDHVLVRTAASYWADRTERMRAFEANHADRVMALRYEHLVTEPTALLQSMFAFVGEAFEPQTLDFNAQHHDQGLEDGKVGLTKGFRPSTRNYLKWTDAELAAAMEEAGPQLAQLGYEQ